MNIKQFLEHKEVEREKRRIPWGLTSNGDCFSIYVYLEKPYEEIECVEIVSLWEIDGLQEYLNEEISDNSEVFYEFVPLNLIEEIIGDTIAECVISPIRLRTFDGTRKFECKERYKV